MENNDIFNILHRHKKELLCDLCRKKFWFFQKAVRSIVRTKENIWVEYYHMKCLEKAGFIRKIKQQKAGRWDDKDPKSTSNVIR